MVTLNDGDHICILITPLFRSARGRVARILNTDVQITDCCTKLFVATSRASRRHRQPITTILVAEQRYQQWHSTAVAYPQEDVADFRAVELSAPLLPGKVAARRRSRRYLTVADSVGGSGCWEDQRDVSDAQTSRVGSMFRALPLKRLLGAGWQGFNEAEHTVKADPSPL